MLSSALYASFFFTVALLVTTAYFLMGGLPLLTLKHDTPLDARFVRGFFDVYYRAAFWASLGRLSAMRFGAGIPLPSAWRPMPASSRCCASTCCRPCSSSAQRSRPAATGRFSTFVVCIRQRSASIWFSWWPLSGGCCGCPGSSDKSLGSEPGHPCALRAAFFLPRQSRSLRCNRGQIFRAAHLFAVRQPNPQTGAFDDDVVHAYCSAFVEKLRAGFVQNHSCDVARWDGWVMTASPVPQWCRQMDTGALRLGKRPTAQSLFHPCVDALGRAKKSPQIAG